jgi:hypothetical protein
MERKARPTVDIEARCACGAVSLRLNGNVRGMFLCSCADCQKSTGTGHSSAVLAARVDVTMAGDFTAFSRPANSGATFTRHFCPVCGTPLHALSSRAPDLLILPTGFFGRNTAWFVPNQLIFARSHNEWDSVPDGLPHYQTYRDEEP